MIAGETKLGFKFVISKRTLHKPSVIYAISEIKEGAPIATIFVGLKKLLGEKQFFDFMEHCENNETEEKYGDDIMIEEYADMFEKISESTEGDEKN